MEEVERARRHGTALSCLSIDVEGIDEITRIHGRELAEHAVNLVGLALRRELRRFDRVGRPGESEFLVVLPGADGPRAEIVARRALERLRAIKIEVGGRRQPLRMSIGLAAWREGMSGEELLGQTRAAAAGGRGAPTAGGGAS